MLKQYIEVISLNGGDQFVCLKLFDDTSLRPTQYVKISTLDEFLKLGIMNFRLHLFYWEKKDDGEYFRKADDSQRLTAQQLIDECTAVREYCKVYYSELVI